MKTKLILFITVLVFVLFSCRKEDGFIEDRSATITLATDSISFDTVFTTIGSTTQNFLIYNTHKERINISSIRLTGGTTSSFRINVDGEAGINFKDIEIAPKDSLYIFVEVTIDPNNNLNPFVIEDYIEFTTNGNLQQTTLVAWGQNAIYYTPTSFNRNLPDFTCLTGPCSDVIAPVDVTWTDSLPYVIYGYVAVDTLDKLTIEAGTKVYFHNNGGLWVYRGGTLKVKGTKNEPVIFRGDRLNAQYDDVPGQWDRIWINEGGFNEINYAQISNAFIGIQAEALFLNGNPTQLGRLEMKNTTISNCSSIGLLSAYFVLEGENLIIDNCGQYNLAIQSLGVWNFNHCTFANYSSLANRETPSVFVQNSYRTPDGIAVDTPTVNINNSIIYGTNESEFDTEVINNGNINILVQNTILKTKIITSDTNRYKSIIKNPLDEIFNAPRMGDFELYDLSKARDVGNLNIANQFILDLKCYDRTTDGKPDLGAVEFR